MLRCLIRLFTLMCLRGYIHCVPKSGPPTDSDNFVKPIFTLLSPLKRGANCKQSPCNISHHTQSMLPHYLWEIKIQISDRLHTRSTFSWSVIMLWCPSAPQSLAIYLCPSGAEHKRRLLPRHAPVAAQLLPVSVMRDLSVNLLTRQRTCTPAVL